MKMFARRSFLQQVSSFVSILPSTSCVCSPLVSKQHKRRVSQHELEDAVAMHASWLDDDSQGSRAVFSNCDLSGLDFLSNRADIIDLRGSDFTDADLSAITGNQVSFHRASLQDARLSGSHLRLPIFCGATLRRAWCNDVVWGWPSRLSPQPPSKVDRGYPRATFINTDLSSTNFDGSRVLGYFSGTRFTDVALRGTDLSHSDFAGREVFCENSFSGV